MKILSTGEKSTLGAYRVIAGLFSQEAVDFIDHKIAECKNGEAEEVIADESEVLILFAHMCTKITKR